MPLNPEDIKPGMYVRAPGYTDSDLTVEVLYVGENYFFGREHHRDENETYETYERSYSLHNWPWVDALPARSISSDSDVRFELVLLQEDLASLREQAAISTRTGAYEVARRVERLIDILLIERQ